MPDEGGRHLEQRTTAVYNFASSLQGMSQLDSTARYLDLVARNIEQAVHARENGNFYALHSAGVPIEFFWPLGITPLSIEIYSTIIGIASYGRRRLLSIPDGTVGCCYHCPNARTFFEVSDFRAWPAPDLAVYGGSSSDPRSTDQERRAGRSGVPCFVLQRPDLSLTSQSMDGWVSRHRLLLQFLEEQTGRSVDHDHLREATRLSYRATQVYAEINALRRARPCPLPAEAAFAPMVVYRAWAGTQACLDFLEHLRDELKNRVARGIGAVTQEVFRYTYATVQPCLNYGMTAEIERRYGAVNVMDHLQWWREDGEWLIDPDDAVASLAYKARLARLGLPRDPAEQAMEIRRAAAECKADGVIFVGSHCCPQVADASRALKDAIDRTLGLPCIAVDCDTQDTSCEEVHAVMDELAVFFATGGKDSRRGGRQVEV
jgi:hypothetical protein